jgi:branched-chain amino acid aminotransferase
MAKFEGVQWAPHQMRFGLKDKDYELLDANAQVFAVSRSIHYSLFLAFEGIRFYCSQNKEGRLEVSFLNWHLNLERLRKGMAFNLGRDAQHLVPAVEELERVFARRYFREPGLRAFFVDMAALGAQGYLRPFTVDEEQSIGVTFPNQPAVRAAVCWYDRYLGEPFFGVAVPHMVRAVGLNKTGCLKLGVNYLVSVKAVDAAKAVSADAASALFLDDRTHLPLEKRQITEWDSSCCLFAFRDGTVVKIPESDLILPSVTIQGIVAILKNMSIKIEERHLTYGELLKRAKKNELIVACSVGTAGILNRCAKLVLIDEKGRIVVSHLPDESHPLYAKLALAREFYWNIYKGKVQPLEGMKLLKYELE